MENNAENWVTLKEAAMYLKVSTSWLYQHGNRFGVPHVKIGKTYRYRHSQLDKWLEGQHLGK